MEYAQHLFSTVSTKGEKKKRSGEGRVLKAAHARHTQREYTKTDGLTEPAAAAAVA